MSALWTALYEGETKESLTTMVCELREQVRATNNEADAFRRGAEAMREAAAKVTDAGRKPCACITKDGDWWQQNCDCSNSGDLAEAQSWCSEQNAADRIRALPLPEAP